MIINLSLQVSDENVYFLYCYFGRYPNLLMAAVLLSNNSVNAFPRKHTGATIGRSLLGDGSVNNPSQQYRRCVFCMVRADGL